VLAYLSNFNRSTVKSYTRKGRVVKSYSRLNTRKKKPKSSSALKTAGVMATALGMPVLAYAGLKVRYNKGLTQSARIALQKSKSIIPNNLSISDLQKPNIHFAVGGLWYTKESKTSGLFKNLVSRAFKGHAVAIDTSGFNILKETGPSKNPLKQLLEMQTPGYRALISKGYNPTARDLAANVYTYQKKYPNQVAVLHGHSSGGFITNETMNILEKMGADMSRVKQVTYGANHFGILPSAKNSMHVVDVNDWEVGPAGFPNPTKIGVKKNKTGSTFKEKLLEDHGAQHYVTSKETQDKVKEFITPRNWKPPVVEKTKPKKVEGLEIVKTARDKFFEKQTKLTKLKQNTNTPESKRVVAQAQAEKDLEKAQKYYKQERAKYLRSRKNSS
jgi:hypothetical protein